ncbi:hypothetical protein FRB91_000137 [Serendipita sp. 411]|nr:hypothetical protein FRB91_000137 [Serendipita sp. 411]
MKHSYEFPPAVINTILSFLYAQPPSFYHPLGIEGAGDLDLDIPSLQNYSLISRTWREQVQRLLFHEVNLGSMRRSIRLRAFFKSFPLITGPSPSNSGNDNGNISTRPPSPNATVLSHGPQSESDHTYVDHSEKLMDHFSKNTTPSGLPLPSYVRILSLSIGQNYTTHIQGTELPDILSLFPYLYELRLTIDGTPALPARTLQSLEPTSCGGAVPPIQALKLTLGANLTNMEIVYQLLQLPWPIQFLSITQPSPTTTSIVDPAHLQTLTPPAYKLLDYRTDLFPGWEQLFEWVVIFSLETITALTIPAVNPSNPTLGLLAPILKTLSLVYDSSSVSPSLATTGNGKGDLFEGMEAFPDMPELLELNLVNATLQKGGKYYQSIPMSVEYFSTTLSSRTGGGGRNNIRQVIEICPTIPMRMEKITVWALEMPSLASMSGVGTRGLMSGWESMVRNYTALDGRLEVRRRAGEGTPMVPFVSGPRDDAWIGKKYMDRAVKNRVLPPPKTTQGSTPQLLRRILSNGSLVGKRLTRAWSVSTKEKPNKQQGPADIKLGRERAATNASPEESTSSESGHQNSPPPSSMNWAFMRPRRPTFAF